MTHVLHRHRVEDCYTQTLCGTSMFSEDANVYSLSIRHPLWENEGYNGFYHFTLNPCPRCTELLPIAELASTKL